LVARLAPVIDAWMLRREAAAQRELVQSLALRLYGAVDAERARLARDLHDDQAQLIAAARIALEAPRAKSRRLFRKIEKNLRARLASLKPATLGRGTLKAALAAEVDRLAQAGIQARVVSVTDVRAIPRPLQNICYQVAREAVSNVIKHARARRVELTMERTGDYARMTIEDDGRGMGQAKGSGMGLTAMAERVEMIGGKLRVESRRGRTRVTAELPLPASERRARTKAPRRNRQ
jgi:signal transduction histidine kinase